MPIPTILLGVLISTLVGAFYHLIRGGSLRRLIFFLVLAWAGFWLGDTLGWYMGWGFAAMGVLNVGMGVVLSVIFLAAGDFASRIRIAPREEV
jgi:hypothetical protein